MNSYRRSTVFDSFLQDPREYAALEALWAQLVQRVASDFAPQPWCWPSDSLVIHRPMPTTLRARRSA